MRSEEEIREKEKGEVVGTLTVTDVDADRDFEPHLDISCSSCGLRWGCEIFHISLPVGKPLVLSCPKCGEEVKLEICSMNDETGNGRLLTRVRCDGR